MPSEPTDQPSAGELTRALKAWSQGQEDALDPFLPQLLQELQTVARSHLRKGGRALALGTGTLIQEAFVKILGAEDATWETRSHFYAYMGTLMQRVVLEALRQRQTLQRGAGSTSVPMDSVEGSLEDRSQDPASSLDVERAFERLALRSERQAQVARLRIFCGFSRNELSEALEISVATVTRDWAVAKRFLARELSSTFEGTP